MRFSTTVAFAVACAFAMAVHAQETRTESKVTGGDIKTVTFTGCVQSGTETTSFVLDKAVPISRTTVTEQPTATSGITTTTTTRYALVPGERVELQEHVGHKVEVTGVMMPGGTVKTETKTKAENSRETRTEEKVKREGPLPQFRVISVKQLAESCS